MDGQVVEAAMGTVSDSRDANPPQKFPTRKNNQFKELR
jgi:hypothetical protein